MNLCVKTKCLKTNLLSNFFRLSSTQLVGNEINEKVLIEDDEDTKARETEIEKKRNVSRLSSAHFNIVNGRMSYTYDTAASLAHLTVKYNRKNYGKYGSASGINPSICWPTKEEIQEKLEYESVAYPFTIPEMMEIAAKKRHEADLILEQRKKDVMTKFAKLEQWKQELKDKIAKKEKEAQAAKEKKERLVEEVRRHFGFKLDPRDERFQEMLVKREKEQKKKEKEVKRLAKEKMMLMKLQQQNVEAGDKAKAE